GHGSAVGSKGHGFRSRLLTLEPALLLAGGHLPKADRFIPTPRGGGQHLAVGGESQSFHPALMSFRRWDRFSSGHVPEPDDKIVGGNRSQGLAIRRKGQEVNGG